MHKLPARLWLLLFAIGVRMAAAGTAEEVSSTRPAVSAANYPVQGLIETLQTVDAPFAQQLADELQAANIPLTTPQAAPPVQAVFDKYALFAVSISPEARVKVELGAADHKLTRATWRTYLVRVQNDALLTAPLVAESKHFVTEEKVPDDAERWLSFQFVDDRDAGDQLAGRRIEYRVARVKTDEIGKRAAVVAMNVGKGTQDLGFRNDVLVLFTSMAPATDATLGAKLTGPDALEMRSSGCTVANVDEALEVEIPAGQSAALEWTTPPIDGPVEAHFRLKTNAAGDQGDYIVYWMVEGSAAPQQFVRVPFIADGQWHDYRLPLADRGRVVGLRFAFPVTAHQASLDNFALAKTAESAAPSAKSLPESVEIGSDELTCRLDCRAHRYTIEDRTTGRVWTSEPVSEWLRLEKVERRSDTELLVTMRDRFHGAQVTATVSLPSPRDVRFAIATDQPTGSMDPCACFPPRFATEMQAGRLIFCDRSCGVLLHQDDPTYAHWPLTVWANTHCLNMPWMGLYDETRGDGAMLLIETPADAEVALVANTQGRHWPEVRWLPTMDTFGYERVASLRFTSAGGYVALAHRYRDYAKQIGRLKTLAEKAVTKPQIERLRGAPVIWGAREPRDFINKLTAAGFNRGTVNQCRDPETVKWLTDQGFLAGRYDSYTDFLEGELAFQRDSVAKAAIRPRPGSAPKLGWKLGGGAQMHWRSSALWQAAQASYVPEELATVPYNSRFVDVAAASNLLEDYHPDHSLDRRLDLANRRQAFEALNERGLVLGTEHGNDWVVDLVETHEGAMSGPFWWSSWPAGYVKRPTREQLSANYLKFGIGYAHRIPLWELVYHDCIVSTWYWGDTAGILYGAAPELAERKDLLNLLYGTPPLVWANGADYRLPEEFPRMLRTLQETLPFHAVVAFEQLTSHEFLSADRAVQRTTFAGGATAVVNFADEPREYDSGSGKVTLAPRGYLVSGPGLSQTKLMVDGAVEAVTSADGRLIVESAAARMLNGIKSSGRVAAFRRDENRWHVLCEAGKACELDLAAVTGWEVGAADYHVSSLSASGEIVAELAKPNERGIVSIPSDDENALFALVRTPLAKRFGPSVEPRTDWQAEWIGVADGSKPNTWICFRKQFTLDELPKSALARIACDSKYWLWLNGKLVVFEGQLKRGPTPNDTYFDAVDLTPHLQAGENQIAILVCHFGRHGFSHNSSGKAGLLFEATLDGRPLLSDATWKAKVHPAFGAIEPPLDNIRLPEANLRFDARRDFGDWQSSKFDESSWKPALAFGRAPIAPWNGLYERPLPQWHDTGLIDYANPLATPFTTTGEPVIGKLPYNCHVTPYFEIEAPAGLTIGLETDIRTRYGKIPQIETHRHEYVTRDGKQAFELPAWINGHEVRYLFPPGVKVLALKYRETSYDTEVVGSFECDDPQLNQLWQEAERTLRVTMRDTYMDCPDRERGQWWGDAVNEIGEAFYVFEPRKSPLLARKAIYELTRWQRFDHTLYSPVPAGVGDRSVQEPIDGSWSKELPQQMLASVGWHGFWNYYLYSGDKPTVVDAYPAVRKYMSLWKLGDDGLVIHRPGEWDWTDWGQHFDTPVCENAWYYLALKGAVAQAKLAGAEQDVAGYEAAMRSIEANFNRVFWREDHYQSAGHAGPTDDRANALAVVAGLAGPEYSAAIVKVLETEQHASPYMEKYVLEALAKLDRPDAAIARMKHRYADMLSDDQSTLWELFDELTLPGFGNVGKGTYNHAWSGGPLTILSQYVAGVAPTAPGFAEYSVRPRLGPLKQLNAKVPTRSGVIELQVQRDDTGVIKLQLNSPPGLQAEVGIPVEADSGPSDVLLNGQPIVRAGKSVAELPGVEFLGLRESRLMFAVPSGEWSFDCRPSE